MSKEHDTIDYIAKPEDAISSVTVSDAFKSADAIGNMAYKAAIAYKVAAAAYRDAYRANTEDAYKVAAMAYKGAVEAYKAIGATVDKGAYKAGDVECKVAVAVDADRSKGLHVGYTVAIAYKGAAEAYKAAADAAIREAIRKWDIEGEKSR